MLKQIALGIVLVAGLLVGTAWADEALNNALFDAVSNGDKAKVEALISKGADVNAKNKSNFAILFYAMHDKDMVELLITKGANVNAKTSSGDTALINAAFAFKINCEVAELLISKGADVNAKEGGGFTPLHGAVSTGRTKLVALLISKGADVNAKDREGETPLDWATKKKRDDAIALLQPAVQKQNEMAALLQAALQGPAGIQREVFNQVMANYKSSVMSDPIRRPFIALAAKLMPAPAVPEEARKYLIRGNALLGDAKNAGEARAAITEYQNALLAAPWWGDAYYNLSKAQELAGDLDGTISSMQYYLLTEPQDKREAQDRLYAIEAKRDKARGK